MKRRTAILISGRGSNMAALIAAAREPAFPARIDLVLSNRPDAAGLATARQAGIRAEALDHRDFAADRAAHEAAINARLRAADIEIVCLAGYLRLLTPVMVTAWHGRMLNIHPSLLPSFPGLHTHVRALQAGVKLHGCSVHLVTQEMDAGPILAQAAVPVLPGDTPDALAQRVLRQEHAIYPAALAAFAADLPGAPPDPASFLANPLGLPPPARLDPPRAAHPEALSGQRPGSPDQRQADGSGPPPTQRALCSGARAYRAMPLPTNQAASSSAEPATSCRECPQWHKTRPTNLAAPHPVDPHLVARGISWPATDLLDTPDRTPLRL